MFLEDWVRRNRNKFGSEYEEMFAENVLPLVEGLRFEALFAQFHFNDAAGADRYCDFMIWESETVRIAVEIDGYDKRGTGTGMSHTDFLDWQRRQASLASNGFHVLRFANRDVRDEPAMCADHISRLLNRLRHAQLHNIKQMEVETGRHETASLGLIREGTSKRTPHRSLITFLLFVVPILYLGARFWGEATFSSKSSDFAAPTAAHVDDRSNVTQRRKISESGLSTVASSDEQQPKEDAKYASTHLPNKFGIVKIGALDCKNPVSWSRAMGYRGQVTTFIGPLLAVKPRPDIAGSPLWLNVGRNFPAPNRLTLVIWGRNWSKFGDTKENGKSFFDSLSASMGDLSVCARGAVVVYKGSAQIEIQDPSQISVIQSAMSR